MKKIIEFSFAFVIVALSGFVMFEGVIVGATTIQHSTSTGPALDMKVILTVTAEYTLSCPSDDVNIGTISGITGGTAEGTATCTAKTNDANGYLMKIAASTTPAMIHEVTPSANYFEDYTTTTDRDYTWSVAANTAEFGFAASSSDIVQAFKNNGADACNEAAGQISNDLCFGPLWGTNLITVSQSSAPTPLAGTDTVFRFKAEIGNSTSVKTGTYHATTTVTLSTGG